MTRLALILAAVWALWSSPGTARTVQRPSSLPISFSEPAFTLESFAFVPIFEAKSRAAATSMRRSCRASEFYAWAPRPGEEPSALTARHRSAAIAALQKAGLSATPLQGALLNAPDTITDGISGDSSAIVQWYTLANATIVGICRDVPIWQERAIAFAVLLSLAAGCLLAHLYVERQWIRKKVRVIDARPRHVDHEAYDPDVSAWRVRYAFLVGQTPRVGSSTLSVNAPEAPPGEAVAILRPKGWLNLSWCASRGPADLSILQLVAAALFVTGVWLLGPELFR